MFDPAKCLFAVRVVALARGTTDDVHVGFRISSGGGYGTPALQGGDLNPLELADFALGFVERRLALNTVAVHRRRSLLLLHVVMAHRWL